MFECFFFDWEFQENVVSKKPPPLDATSLEDCKVFRKILDKALEVFYRRIVLQPEADLFFCKSSFFLSAFKLSVTR